VEEINFEILDLNGRIRNNIMSTPALPIPWHVIHKIDEISPLYDIYVNKLNIN